MALPKSRADSARVSALGQDSQSASSDRGLPALEIGLECLMATREQGIVAGMVSRDMGCSIREAMPSGFDGSLAAWYSPTALSQNLGLG